MGKVLFSEWQRWAALADVAPSTMRKVVEGAPITNRARARAYAYLQRAGLLGRIARTKVQP